MLLLALSSCIEDKCEETITYEVYRAVTRPVAEIRALEPEAEAARELCQSGNIYVYGDYLLIAEVEEGLHIYDNQQPESPQALAFLPVPGLTNMAVRNSILYLNSYMDLLTFRLDNPTQPEFISRLEDVFQSYTFMTDQSGENRLVTSYEPTQETINADCDQRFWRPWGRGWMVDECFNCAFFDVAVPLAQNAGAADDGAGIGGSMARFTIANGNLYVVGDFNLQVFDLDDPVNPALAGDVHLGNWGIETIIPYGDHLFIGSQNGMYIFNNEEPLAPYQVGYYEHTRACDPVYVAGDRAYVTLRDGNEVCQGFSNQLDVVDITDYSDPELVTSHNLVNPHGLSVDADELFICDGRAGFKVFDRTDDFRIGDRLLSHFESITTADVITLKSRDIALVIGQEGLYQFDYSNVEDLRLLSVIPTCGR